MRWTRGTTTGFLVIALVGIIGILIPFKMFGLQEHRLLSDVGNIPFVVSDETCDSDTVLEESEYKKIIRSMNHGGATYYREPVNGQINMQKAVELAIQGINKLMAESLGFDELTIDNFINIKAVLQTKEENYHANPQYSFWNIQMSSKNEVIHVWMNSVSGMILKIDVELLAESDMKVICLDDLLVSYKKYSGFNLVQGKEETPGDIYHNSYECVYKGKYFKCNAAKYLCASTEQLRNYYVKVILSLEE